jgi:diacylglycerol kinase (ATP)
VNRLLKALRNSISAGNYLLANEAAYRQEAILLFLSLPAAWLLSEDLAQMAQLVGILVLLLVVEAINTAIEATCNAITRDHDDNIKLAKDCGSLAVLLVLGMAAALWLLAIWNALADRI